MSLCFFVEKVGKQDGRNPNDGSGRGRLQQGK